MIALLNFLFFLLIEFDLRMQNKGFVIMTLAG
jgi:hypothetical protein